MPMIEVEPGAVQIDAAVIGEGLGIETERVQHFMREGKITGRYERGVGEDAGRWRLTFSTQSRRLSLIVDGQGNMLQRSVVVFGSRPVRPDPHGTPAPRKSGSDGDE